MTQNIDDRLADIDKLLAEYSQKVGVGYISKPDVDQYLNLSTTDLRKMTGEELGEISVQVYRLANYIQLDSNKHSARLNWAQKYLEYIIAADIDNVGSKYMPYTFRIPLAIKQNDVATKLQKLISSISIYIDSMDNIPYSLRCYANSLEKLQQTKRKV